MKKILTTIAFLIILSSALIAQVGIGTTTPNTSAALDVSSTSKGLLIPQMTLAQRIGIANPATGLLIYQTDNFPGYYYNTGTPASPSWISLASSILQQNVNTNGRWISANGSNQGIFVSSTGVGIGTSNPTAKLEVAGDINYSGILNIGLFTDYELVLMQANSSRALTRGCPVGYSLLSGGGGSDEPSLSSNITVNYSGLNPANTNEWLLRVTNSSSNTRFVEIHTTCAKVQ